MRFEKKRHSMQLQEWVDGDRVRRCRVRVALLPVASLVAIAAVSVPSTARVAGLDPGGRCAALPADESSKLQGAPTRVTEAAVETAPMELHIDKSANGCIEDSHD